MAYESPISVWWSDTKIEQLRDEYNNIIVKAVKKCCPQVDEDELIKALRYDREQYEKGYRDGRLYQPPVLTNADKIRAMSDEELAEMLESECPSIRQCPDLMEEEMFDKSYHEMCKKCWLDWLRQEANR